MKLRNKKTGEIKEYGSVGATTFGEGGVLEGFAVYNSLAELNEEWEDYEEDELLYVISAEHKSGYQCVLKEEHPEICEVAKELGIGFETEKECREVVEKLKAWKRLEDKGFRIRRNNYHDGMMYLHIWNDTTDEPTPLDKNSETFKDLDLLFGGEE